MAFVTARLQQMPVVRATAAESRHYTLSTSGVVSVSAAPWYLTAVKLTFLLWIFYTAVNF